MTFLILAAAAAAKPTTGGKGQTPHEKVVAGICHFVQDKPLCFQTLKNVPTDDPIELIRSLPSAAEAAVRNSIKFLAGVKPKYKGQPFATTCINSCEEQLNYAIDDFADFWKLAGNNLTSLANNYFTCKQKIISIFTYHSTCLDDIDEEKVLKEVKSGIGLGKNLSGEAVDVLVSFNDILKSFGIMVKLNQEDTEPLQPSPFSI